MKSNAKRQRNNFVRGIRAEVSINCYTRALGFVQTRDREQAVKLLEDRIAAARRELVAVSELRQSQGGK